jgi:hypothetical protein
MEERKNVDGDSSQPPADDSVDHRKPWAPPFLKTLPVPGYTRGGAFDFEDHDNKNLYNIS